MYVMGRAPACFPGFLLNGSEEGHCAMEGEVFLCGPTRGRWVLFKEAPRLWLEAEWNPSPASPDCPALQQVFPTVVGDWDSSGSLNAQVLLLLAERLRAKAVFQVTHAPASIRGFLSSMPVLLQRPRGRSRANSDGREGGSSYFSRFIPDTAVQVPDLAV